MRQVLEQLNLENRIYKTLELDQSVVLFSRGELPPDQILIYNAFLKARPGAMGETLELRACEGHAKCRGEPSLLGSETLVRHLEV